MRRTIVCLANSYKHGGRCVAGICLENGKWIRLRSADGDGSLSPHEYTLDNGQGELRLLDVFEAELHYAMPSDCHPEDWVTLPQRWQLVERSCSPTRWQQVLQLEDLGTSLLNGYRDRVSAEELHSKPAGASLALISPEDIWWWVRQEGTKRRNRVLFKRNHVSFNLPVTDPRWIDQLNLLPVGIYPNKLLAPTARKTWLTVSLSEAFQASAGAEAWHYRIVAGVVTQ
jgi:hypothetical protein